MRKLLAVIALSSTLISGSAQTVDAPTMRGDITEQTAKLPLRFESNAGQWDARVRFVAQSKATKLFITDDAMSVQLVGTSSLVTLGIAGAKPTAPRGEKELVTKCNYFLGNDPTRWRTDVPTFARVRTKDWLPGVDVVWHGGDGAVEYDLEVAAGVDATALVLTFDGAESVDVDRDGSLVIATRDGALIQKPPRVIQDGRDLRAQYVPIGETRVRLTFDGYRRELPMLIDPVLAYATYLGGGGVDEFAGMAIDAGGNMYLTGYTHSTDFPIKSAVQGTYPGGTWDAFVTKLNAAGSAIVYSTYLGGSTYDVGVGIAVDATGNAYVTGYTQSTNFPTAAPFQAANAGGSDAFVAKLNSSGALVYSTYLGGTLSEQANHIAVDTSGNAYITGSTSSTNFPTHTPIQAANAGASDAFVTKLNAAGSALAYSTYLGGSSVDTAFGIAVDGSGNAYVTGKTYSNNFRKQSAIQSVYGAGGSGTAFVSKLNAAGTALTYSTYLGGSGTDSGNAIAADANGNAYVTGFTQSPNFPMQVPLQATNNSVGGGTAFVTALNATGSSFVYSTYLGGSGKDIGLGIAVDVNGSAYVTGETSSTDFPLHNAFQLTNAGGNYDAFVSKLTPSGAAFDYSTYLGGSGTDIGENLVVGANGDAYVGGNTDSVDFPTQSPYQSSNHGVTDAFAATLHSPDFALGTACAPGECASGNCVDGVCCDTPCDGECEACDLPNQVGTCAPVTGVPHGSREACGGVIACEACDGINTKACSLAGSGTPCGATCSTALETDSYCDGKGHCGTVVAHSCNNLTCNSDGKTCKTSCATDVDCVNGYACEDGGCTPSARCTDDHTAQPASGPAQDCTPYVCVVGAGCKRACESISDCVAPNVCAPNGECVPAPSTSSGCACQAGSSGAPWWMTLLMVGTVVAAAGRRRRRA